MKSIVALIYGLVKVRVRVYFVHEDLLRLKPSAPINKPNAASKQRMRKEFVDLAAPFLLDFNIVVATFANARVTCFGEMIYTCL